MEVSPLVRTLLEKRGLAEAADIEVFLRPDYDRDTHSPFLLADMDTAVARIVAAMERGERIAVYADFDCDGIPGAALLHDLFVKIAYEHVEVYIPHRDREGYGFHTAAIDALAARSVSLIITVDVGTTAHEAVRYAKEKGVDVIVTDHHELPPAGGQLPDAVAVLNPKREGYPFPHLCGAAVAHKLASALIARLREQGDARVAEVPEGWEKWLLDMVAIATVADMVPLTGENRVLAHFGLTVLRKSLRPGIAALCTALRLRQRDLTEDDIGFSIAPRINAASRMDSPELAFRLLTTRDRSEATQLAAQLEKLNMSRKGVVGAIVREARKRMHDRFGEEERVVVLGDTEWKPALLGLAANSLMNDRGGVVCLWGRDAEGRLKGSCRSDGSLSVVELFGATTGHLEEHGGHEMSGGFSVPHEHVHTLHDAFRDAAARIPLREVARAAAYDASAALFEVHEDLLSDISQLAPFGIGNPKPVFCIRDAHVMEVRVFGKEKNHIEVALACSVSSVKARAFDFFRTAAQFSHAPVPRTRATVLATVGRDSYRGGIALRLIDVLPPEAVDGGMRDEGHVAVPHEVTHA
jgi:single-stranded-DNA-specific exonuclease